HLARPHRFAVELHRAGAALPKPTAKARVVQSEFVPQRIKQRHAGIIDLDLMHHAINVQPYPLNHVPIHRSSTSYHRPLQPEHPRPSASSAPPRAIIFYVDAQTALSCPSFARSGGNE